MRVMCIVGLVKFGMPVGFDDDDDDDDDDE